MGRGYFFLDVRCGERSFEHGNFINRETAELMASQDAFLVPTLVTYSPPR
jgi:hypothetical protein